GLCSAHRREEGLRQAGWQPQAERVAVTRGVLDRDETLLPRDAKEDRASLVDELCDERVRRHARLHARADLFAREVAESEERVVERVGVLRGVGEALERLLV